MASTVIRTASLAVGCLFPALSVAAGPTQPFEPPAPRRTDAAQSSSALLPAIQGLRTGRWPAVLIDGRWVQAGDPLAAGRIVDVLPAGVIFRARDGSMHRLLPREVPAPAAAASAAPAGPTPAAGAAENSGSARDPATRKEQS